MPKNEGSEPKGLTRDELAAQLTGRTMNPAPIEEVSPQTVSAPKGGAFMAGDGRTLYKYVVGGETVILPKPIEQMSEQDFYNYLPSDIQAEAGRLPQNLTVKFRDPQWAGHWFNRKANQGQRVKEARAMGFIPATTDDCDWVPSEVNENDGAIIDNDLVLMKIHKALLFRKYKTWMDIAAQKGGKDSYMATAQANVGGSEKVSHYFTPQSNEFSGVGPVTQIPVIS